ncbi:unnamed protein product [Cuscuta europaea]|uniref:Uncharacterized protein n=1 Tax=Cuscuta europaea TaxID=41803 RepID=A0A9P1E5F6_CUSEU|nr:unnamed protein product [Cuscuta europaea]
MTVAIPSNRSQSPSVARPRISSPDTHSAARRSFSGSASTKPFPLSNPRRTICPTTPANSPADSVRRGLPDKEEIRAAWDCSEKENERAAKLRSPAKNFMSPTISAASKFCPSPKKKVLVERNEPVRSSISLCDGKATFFSSIPPDSTENSKPKSEICLDTTKSVRKVTFSEAPLHIDHGTVVMDSSFSNETSPKNTNSCYDFSPSIVTSLAPLVAANPSGSPYDPKTNYLSPRPQFLHYRPKPRIEALKSMENGCDVVGESRHLDEAFVSTIEDSEPHIEESRQDSDDSPPSPTTTEEEIVAQEPKTFEEETVMKLESEGTIREDVPGQKKEMKSRSYTGSAWAVTVLLLIMIAAGMSKSASNCPLVNFFGMKDLMKKADLSPNPGPRIQSAMKDGLQQLWISSSCLSHTNSTSLIGGRKWELLEYRGGFKKLEENEMDKNVEYDDLGVKEDDAAAEEEVDSDDEEEGIEGEGDEDIATIEEVYSYFGDGGQISVLEEVVAVEEGQESSSRNQKGDEDIELDSPIVPEGSYYTNVGESREVSVAEVVVDEDGQRSSNDEEKINDCSSWSSENEMQEEEVEEEDDGVELVDGPPIDDHHVVSNTTILRDSSIDEKSNSKADDDDEESPVETLQQEGSSISTARLRRIPLSLLLLLLSVAAAVFTYLKQCWAKKWVAAAVEAGLCPSGHVSSTTSYSSNRERRKSSSSSSHRRESIATSIGECLSYGSFTTYERIPIKHHHQQHLVSYIYINQSIFFDF